MNVLARLVIAAVIAAAAAGGALALHAYRLGTTTIVVREPCAPQGRTFLPVGCTASAIARARAHPQHVQHDSVHGRWQDPVALAVVVFGGFLALGVLVLTGR